MIIDIEELDFRSTPIGDLLLRRRRDPLLGGQEIFEVKLGEHFLMSSLFTVAEIALADLGLDALSEHPDHAADALEVVVGGLGLGYTAAAALDHGGVGSLVVIEALEAVIEWHQRGLLPLKTKLSDDPRCTLTHADFFERVTSLDPGFDDQAPGRRFHAILLDVDHTPSKVLDPKNAALYTDAGMRGLTEHLLPGGVFGLWSDDPPDPDFEAVLARVFASTESRVVEFPNPYRPGTAANTVYLARTSG